MKITYKTQGTCSSHIEVEVEDDVIQQVFFWGGCNGNLQGISRLVKGMKVEEVLQKLEGVKCGNRSTSCPDQLCKALREMKQDKKRRGCLKIELRWPLLFHLQLKSFGFFSKKEFINLLLKVSSFQTFFFRCHKPPKRLLLQDYVQWPAGRTQFQPS